MSFYDDFGLINAKPGEKNGENALLFTVEHFFLVQDKTERFSIRQAIHTCQNDTGIYEQNPARLLKGKDKYMSHDQLTAIIAFSYYNNLDIHIDIWNEIKRQWFRYNNMEIPQTFMEKLLNKRFLHPRDIIFYGYCAGSTTCKLLLPLLWLFMALSSIKTYKKRPHGVFIATDGKILNFVRIKACMEKSWLWKLQWKLNTWIVKKKLGSWNRVFNIYFPFDDHPNVTGSKNI